MSCDLMVYLHAFVSLVASSRFYERSRLDATHLVSTLLAGSFLVASIYVSSAHANTSK